MADSQGMDSGTRQKVVILILVVVAAFIGWQLIGMFSSEAKQQSAAKKAAATRPAAPPMPAPKVAEFPKAAPLTQREMELMQLQQETEARYIAAVNELQMLKIQRDIAETNKAITSAKLATVSSQKNIITMLAPEQTANYSQRLTNPAQGSPTGGGTPQTLTEITYTVISVSEIQGRWGAVIGAQGKLYSVRVGDVLPADRSTVISIDRSGIVLEKEGVKKIVSLVPII